MEQFYDYIIKALSTGTSREDVYRNVKEKGIGKIRPSDKEWIRILWLDAELAETHKNYVIEKYPQIGELKSCIREYREIYEKKNMPLLYLFIEKYKKSGLKSISRFAKGLEKTLKQLKTQLLAIYQMDLLKGQITSSKW